MNTSGDQQITKGISSSNHGPSEINRGQVKATGETDRGELGISIPK